MSDDHTGTTDRRSFCKYLVGGGLAATLSVGTVAGDPLESDYRSVIDVADAGAATDGSESVAPVIQDVIDDDTLLKFPAGRYYFDEQVRLTDFYNLGLVGSDATLVPATYWNFDGPQYRLFRLGTYDGPGRDLLIDSFTVDQRANATGIRAFEAQVEDGLAVEYVDVVGRHDSGTWGPGLFTITDPNGGGYVESFRARDGGAPNDETPGDLWGGPSGILCNGAHRGYIRFTDCHLGGFPDNGLYASGGSGYVAVEGGHYENSGTASVRLGGGGAIRGTQFVVDEDPFGRGQEAIRIDDGGWFDVENVTVDCPEPNGEAIHVTNKGPSLMIQDSSIAMDVPAHAGVQVDAGSGNVYLKNVDISMDDCNRAVMIEGTSGGEVGLVDVEVTGDATGHPMRDAIRCERDHCYFRSCTISQHGGSRRRGITLLGDDALVYDCIVATSGRPLSVSGDDAWIQDNAMNADGNAASIAVFDSVRGIRLKNNWLPDGIEDWGATGVFETGTMG